MKPRKVYKIRDDNEDTVTLSLGVKPHGREYWSVSLKTFPNTDTDWYLTEKWLEEQGYSYEHDLKPKPTTQRSTPQRIPNYPCEPRKPSKEEIIRSIQSFHTKSPKQKRYLRYLQSLT